MPEQVFEQNIERTSIEAAADLSSYKGCVVSPVSGALSSTGGEGGGILQNAPKQGEAAVIAVGGIAIGLAGDTITKDQLLTNEATTARLIPATTGNKVVGRAMTSAGDGEKVSVLLLPGYPVIV